MVTDHALQHQSNTPRPLYGSHPARVPCGRLHFRVARNSPYAADRVHEARLKRTSYPAPVCSFVQLRVAQYRGASAVFGIIRIFVIFGINTHYIIPSGRSVIVNKMSRIFYTHKPTVDAFFFLVHSTNIYFGTRNKQDEP